MMTFLTIVHVATIVLLVIAVLLQSGKGAEISATFGGSSQTVFGSSGGQNFFQKLTYGLAAVFMVTSLTLTILPSKSKKSVFEGFTPPAPQSTEPVKPPAPMGGDAPSAQKQDATKVRATSAKANKAADASGAPKAAAPKAAAPATSAPATGEKK